MAIIIPTFEQFQGVLYPLRGLWNRAPAEGDRFVNAEIDWGTYGSGVSCVQFQLSGNSPVAFSQIVAMSVDNRRCGSDVEFIYPDSGFVLAVPGFNQGVYPVFSNALMFYASSPTAALGDITIVQILNSMPPPVAIQPAGVQQNNGVFGLALTNGVNVIVPPPVNGTLEGFALTALFLAGATGTAAVSIQDGNGVQLWQSVLEAIPSTQLPITVSGLRLRFQNGLRLVITGSTITNGSINVNLYYSVP